MKKVFMIFAISISLMVALVTGAQAADKYTSNHAEVDATTANKGYISVKYIGGESKKIKVRIEKGDGMYTYDLNTGAKYEVYSMNMGDGQYTVKVMQNITDNKYAVLQTNKFDVKLDNKNMPFLVPTQYVNFSDESKVVEKAAELTKNVTSTLEKIDIIYKYVTELLTYDYDKAATVKSGYLPEVDKILAAKKGICFDYSAMMGAMLRSLDIPTKLVTGYVSKSDVYHAWNEVYVEGKGWIKTGELYFDGESWKLMDSTFQSTGKGNTSVTKLIGDGTSYSKKYEY